MILHGRNPYGADLTREIQIGFYGRPLNPQNRGDPTDRESFVYPLYVAFLFAPTVTLPFRTVAEVFRWLLLASIAFSVPLWMYALRLRFKWPLMFAGALLAGSSYPAVEEYFQQNLAALVILFIAAAAAAARKWLTLSGFLLALATVKPYTSGARLRPFSEILLDGETVALQRLALRMLNVNPARRPDLLRKVEQELEVALAGAPT